MEKKNENDPAPKHVGDVDDDAPTIKDTDGNVLPEIPEPPRMKREEMIALAKDIVAGRVFGTWNVPEGQDPRMPFMVMGLAGIHPKTGACYEYLDKAGPRSVNGMPMFFSQHNIHADDLEELNECLEKVTEALKSVT